jgi:hypothetical protein
MGQVFVSYSRQNAALLDEFETWLESEGFSAWTDRDLEGGEEWRGRIEAAIRKSFALVVLVTPSAMESDYVSYEWSFARGAGVTVIPVLLEATPHHAILGELQHVDFMTRRAEEAPKLLRRLRQLERDYWREALKDARFQHRMRACRRLGELKAEEAIPDLVNALWHDRSVKAVRPAAAQALAKIGTAEALAELRKWRA